MTPTNPYLDQISQVLPRVFALFDRNPLSPSRGVGDRFYWGWKLIDFGNGSFQGAAHAFAKILQFRSSLSIKISQEALERRIENCFEGLQRLVRRDGSLEEAFPYEMSFCVTAQVAFDLLASIEVAGAGLTESTRKSRLSAIEPLINFLKKSDESHGLIANHLATASAALLKWENLSGAQPSEYAAKFLHRLLKAASDEGWFPEYGGADPGYQSLALHYLADIDRMFPEMNLAPRLNIAASFLAQFAHPDGSFGGVYGSRETRFYFPSGVEYLAQRHPDAKALAAFMRRSIGALRTVSLVSMDDHNLIPMLNSYASAAHLTLNQASNEQLQKLPCETNSHTRDFPGCGLHIRSTETHYTIVNSNKGGCLASFDKKSQRSMINSGSVVKDAAGRFLSTNHVGSPLKLNVSPEAIEIDVPFYSVQNRLPKPWQFLLLRMLNLSVMRIPAFSKWFKKVLVGFLITGRHATQSYASRSIRFNGSSPVVSSQIHLKSGENLESIDLSGEFSNIHMASRGYWQIQDDS